MPVNAISTIHTVRKGQDPGLETGTGTGRIRRFPIGVGFPMYPAKSCG